MDPFAHMREALGAAPLEVHVGIVTDVSDDEGFGVLATVELATDGRPVSCRPFYAGANGSGGYYAPIVVGDEALVLLPGGEVHEGIALVGAGNRSSRSLAIRPGTVGDVFDGDGSVRHLEGPHKVVDKAANAFAAEPVVLQTFLTDFATALTTVAAQHTTLATQWTTIGAALPVISGAASASQAAHTAIATALNQLKGNITLSNAVNAGPYLSDLLKAAYTQRGSL